MTNTFTHYLFENVGSTALYNDNFVFTIMRLNKASLIPALI